MHLCMYILSQTMPINTLEIDGIIKDDITLSRRCLTYCLKCGLHQSREENVNELMTRARAFYYC